MRHMRTVQGNRLVVTRADFGRVYSSDVLLVTSSGPMANCSIDASPGSVQRRTVGSASLITAVMLERKEGKSDDAQRISHF